MEAFAPGSLAGGLNLLAGEVNAEPADALVAVDVDFTPSGGIKSRGGRTERLAAPAPGALTALASYVTASHRHTIAAGEDALYAYSSNGALMSSRTALAERTFGFVRFGTPSAEYLVAGNGRAPVYVWDGAGWLVVLVTVNGETLQVLPRGQSWAVQTPDNRLWAGGFYDTTGGPGGTPSTPHDVFVSDPGGLTEWAVNNRITFTPGDGERITAIVSWRNQMFVFKETKFFVCGGNSVGPSGDPVFNWQEVNAKVGCVGVRAAVAGKDGVYFADKSGIYRTIGGVPELLSVRVNPIFRGHVPDTFAEAGFASISDPSKMALEIHEDRLYVAHAQSGSANTHVLVHDLRMGWWSLYRWAASDLHAFDISAETRALLGTDVSATSKGIKRHDPNYTDDVGQAIVAQWWSGWADMGAPQVKTARQLRIWSRGPMRYRLARDYQDDAAATAVAVNFAGTVDNPQGRVLRGASLAGEVFSTRLSSQAAGAAWEVYRYSHQIAGRSSRAVV